MRQGISESVIGLIGSHTFVQTNIFSDITGDNSLCFKLEHTNPGGSIKDKNALFLIKKALERGDLKPGGTIIESSSGNLGIGLAMVGKAMGFNVKIVIDKKTSNTMKKLIELYGAQTVQVSEEYMDEAGSMQKARMNFARELESNTSNSWYACQHLNPDTAEVHFHHTAPEIEKAYEGAPDIIVVGVSTAGQLAGLSRFFKQKYPSTQVWAVDVKGSGVFQCDRHHYKMTGLGLSFTPPAFDWSLVDRAFNVSDELSFSLCHKLCTEEGLFLGASSGSVLGATLRAIKEDGIQDKKICLVSSDSGYRYLDTFYNENWLLQNDLRILNDDEILTEINRTYEHHFSKVEYEHQSQPFS